VQRPEIGAGGQKRVGAPCLGQREIRRGERDAFELGTQPRDAVEVEDRQALGRDGAAGNPTAQLADGRKGDVLFAVRQRTGRDGGGPEWRGVRHREARQAGIEAHRGREIVGQRHGTAPYRKVDLGLEVVGHQGALGLVVAHPHDGFRRRDLLGVEDAAGQSRASRSSTTTAPVTAAPWAAACGRPCCRRRAV
jgi:hypothetical protein